MKRKILVLLVLIPMLFILCGCSDEKVKNAGSNDKTNVDKSEELTIDGTGEVKLKEFVESFKVMNKTWTEVSVAESKLYYKVNENDITSTIPLPDGGELWGSYSGKENYVSIESNGVTVDLYNESVSVKDINGASIRIVSEDIDLNKAVPSDVRTDYISFNMVVKSPDFTEENKQQIINNSKRFSTFIGENKCDSLKAILKALGMEESDKTVFEAIEKGFEYNAEYKSDLGNVEMTYYSDGMSKTLTFKFDDECDIEEININEMDEEYREIQISIYKNLEK